MRDKVLILNVDVSEPPHEPENEVDDNVWHHVLKKGKRCYIQLTQTHLPDQ